MKVTKYYCDTCLKEVSSEELTTVTIAVKHKNNKGSPGEIESYSNSICDDCLIEVGLVETPATELSEPIKRETNNPPTVKYVLWDREKFLNIIKNLISRRREKDD